MTVPANGGQAAIAPGRTDRPDRGPDDPDYAGRAARAVAARDIDARTSLLISRARLAVFLPAAACLIWALTRGTPTLPLAAALALFAVFGALVVWHVRVDDRVAWHEAVRRVNVRGQARAERDWDALPVVEPPPFVDVANHPYAMDLDVFGRASLYRWIGPSATVGGSSTLAQWLTTSASGEVIRQRQDAVGALVPLDAWRESLAAHGVLAAGARHHEIDRFLEWAEGRDPLGSYAAPLRVAVAILTASILTLLGLDLIGIVTTPFWLVPMTIGIVLSFAMASYVHRMLDRAGAGQHALGRYAGILEHAVAAPDASELLSRLHQRLSVDDVSAPRCMRRLNRILGFGSLRQSAAILHFPIQALTLWDFWVVFVLERWRRRTGTRVRSWFEAVGELDALALFATVRRDNPSWCLPDVMSPPVGPDATAGRASIVFDARALGHPLLTDDRRVHNDVTVGPPGTILLVTGSNMSGKSTLLRAIGLNAVLAQAGCCVCAASLRMPECDVQTSIRVQDSLELGLSYFMAALARLKGVVDAAEHERDGRVLLYLLDEILQGTNSAERSIAVRAVARHLLEAGAIGAMTTHDLNLANEEPLRSAATLVHFTEVVDEHGAMRFDYTLRPGLATSRNALRLMQLIGIEL